VLHSPQRLNGYSTEQGAIRFFRKILFREQSAKLSALIKILFLLPESENDSPHREDFENEKISVLKNSLIEAAHSLREENSHFAGKAIFFQYFQMKEIYFLTLQRPDCLRSSRPWRK
jgi:hypothetical protein